MGGQPGSSYDDPRDYEEWCDWNDADIEEGYYHPDRLNEEGGFVYFKDAFGTDTDPIVVASVISEASQQRYPPRGRQTFVVTMGWDPEKSLSSSEI